MRIGRSEAGWPITGLGLALLVAFALTIINQGHLEANQRRVELNQRRIAALQLQVTQLSRQAAAGQLDREQLRRLVQALQRQLRSLGVQPVDHISSPGTPEPTASPDHRDGSPEPTRSPSPPPPTPSPSPRPDPSPTPSPLVSVCPHPPLCLVTVRGVT